VGGQKKSEKRKGVMKGICQKKKAVKTRGESVHKKIKLPSNFHSRSTLSNESKRNYDKGGKKKNGEKKKKKKSNVKLKEQHEVRQNNGGSKTTAEVGRIL